MGDPVVEGGHGPIQFVTTRERLRMRHRVKPFDMATSRFSTMDVDPDDNYGG